MTRSTRLALAAGAALLLLTPGAAAATPTTDSIPTVTVVTRDFAFQMPERIPAGAVAFRLVNEGAELHHVSIVKLAPGKSAADYFEALRAGKGLPAWAINVGGPNAPEPGPGKEVRVAVTLAEGRYVAICFIPSPDGTPHVMKGMLKEFTVVPSGRPAALPAGTVTMTLTDYDFVLSKPLAAGRNVIVVKVDAPQPHEVHIWRLAPGKTALDVAAWAEKPQGPPPATVLGGIAAADRGQTNLWTLDLTPGEYALLCFIPDAKDGKPHVAHGMHKQITVR